MTSLLFCSLLFSSARGQIKCGEVTVIPSQAGGHEIDARQNATETNQESRLLFYQSITGFPPRAFWDKPYTDEAVLSGVAVSHAKPEDEDPFAIHTTVRLTDCVGRCYMEWTNRNDGTGSGFYEWGKVIPISRKLAIVALEVYGKHGGRSCLDMYLLSSNQTKRIFTYRPPEDVEASFYFVRDPEGEKPADMVVVAKQVSMPFENGKAVSVYEFRDENKMRVYAYDPIKNEFRPHLMNSHTIWEVAHMTRDGTLKAEIVVSDITYGH